MASSIPNFRDDLERFQTHPETFSRRDCLYISGTPASLVMLGLQQKPIFITQAQMRNMMRPKNPKNIHLHGVPKGHIENIPDLLASPAIILDALNNASEKNAIVEILSAVDYDQWPLLAVIKPNGKSQYDCQVFESNHLLSLYGRSNFMSFFNTAVAENKILYIDKIKTESLESQAELQLLRGLQDLPFDRIIHQSQVIGKSDPQKESRTKERPRSLRDMGEQARKAAERLSRSHDAPSHERGIDHE